MFKQVRQDINERFSQLSPTQKKALMVLPVLGLVAALSFAGVKAAEEAHEQEIQGVVEVIPANRQGTWKVAGRQVTVNATTKIKEKNCVLKAGALAEVEYTTSGQTLIAKEIKCETEIEIKGMVQAMPANRIGVWKIGNQTLTANAQTHFEDQQCPIKVGRKIEVKVKQTAQGLVLSKVECEEEDDD